MKYRTKSKQGTYEHFCILVLAQSPWKDLDKERIRNIALEKKKEIRDEDYHFYDRLVYRDKQPEYSLCLLCNQIYKLFINLKQDRDFILYQGHHYIVTDDYLDLLEFTKLLLSDEKVKKIYVLYLDSLIEFRKEDINKMFYDDFIELIYERKCTIKDFESIIHNQKFKERVLYEILKESYY